MPVMLMPEDYDRWLDPAMNVDQLRGMLKPSDAEMMRSYEVSRVVNSVKNDTPECTTPLSRSAIGSERVPKITPMPGM